MDAFDDLEDVLEVREVRNVRDHNPRVFRQRIDPFEYLNDREFRSRYRLTKEAVRFVVNLVSARLETRANRITDTSPTLQVLVTLRYYAKGCYQVELGDLHGLSQSTVSRIVRAVSVAIAEHLPTFIKFPQRVEDNQRKFYNLAQCPKVVGCIDCTHIQIKCPNRDVAQLYCNRKGFYSLNVQVICDADRRIMDIVARWRGSVHDARIWDSCAIKEEFEASRIGGLLLGDSGYPNKPYLLTPFLNPRTIPEERYNYSQIRTRITVERCFGEWKGMFRALRNNMQINLATAKTAIVAMAVLFNIRKDLGDNDGYDTDSDDEVEENEELIVERVERHDASGSLFRQNFVSHHFN